MQSAAVTSALEDQEQAKSARLAAQEEFARQSVVTSKEDAERRRFVYTDVEELITPGFLTEQVVVAGVGLSLRSLYPGEMGLLRHRVGLVGTARRWKEWAIASAVWVVDGQVLVGDVNAASRVRGFLAELPKSVLEGLFGIYTRLYNRVRVAVGRVEAYCYEDHARASWRMVGRLSPARDEVVGIPGVSSLGMNHVQRLWMAYNLSEDDRQTWHQDWAAAKLIASASSPKGVKRMNQRDDSERKMEEDRRKRVMDNLYREVTGRDVGEESGMVVYRASSAEELIEEMNRAVRGEKDSHDLAVDAYKARIREKHESDRVAHEARMRELERMRTESDESGIGGLTGYTLEQLRELRGGELIRRGTPVASPSAPSRLYDRYVAQDYQAGGLDKNGKAAPVPRHVASDGEPSGLDQAIAGRRVKISDGGE